MGAGRQGTRNQPTKSMSTWCSQLLMEHSGAFLSCWLHNGN